MAVFTRGGSLFRVGLLAATALACANVGAMATPPEPQGIVTASPSDRTASPPPITAAPPAAASHPAAERPPVVSARDQLARRLTADDATVAGEAIDIAVVRRFYKARGNQPAWLAASPHEDGVIEFASAGGAVLATLRDAASHGLDPRAYHVDAIDGVATGAAGAGRATRAVSLELLLTDGLMRYAADVRSGLVKPRSVGSDIDLDAPVVDRVAAAERVVGASDTAAALAALAPAGAAYEGLRALLAYLRAADRAGGWPALDLSAGAPRKLEAGQSDPMIPSLAKRLVAMGDLSALDPAPAAAPAQTDAAAASVDPNLYDETLVAAVKRFQFRHGLETDGVIGPATLAALNTSLDDRIDQVVVNFERVRWRPGFSGRYVLVNAPDYRLTAYENGAVVRDMRVIVGTKARRTPLFSSEITSVVLNPTWTMPVRLAREDYLPKLLKNPRYLAEHGFTVYAGWGEGAEVVDSTAVDWSSVGHRIGGMRLRQEPGPMNPLGRIKFNIRNDFDVYLHDTPSRGKFQLSARALSSGCVRLGDPAAMADFAFADMPAWDAAGRQVVIDSLNTKTIALRTPIPVHLLYRTAWMGEDGTPRFRADIYDRDEELSVALRRAAPRTKVASRE